MARSELNEQTRRRQASRFLATNSAQWRKIRKAVLEREPLCRSCGAAANEVDHIDGNTANNLPSNLAALCKPCHSAKTIAENRGELSRHDTPAPRNARGRERNSNDRT
jgi:5-methylcytosine-specific restriction endonuclease McrA